MNVWYGAASEQVLLIVDTEQILNYVGAGILLVAFGVEAFIVGFAITSGINYLADTYLGPGWGDIINGTLGFLALGLGAVMSRRAGIKPEAVETAKPKYKTTEMGENYRGEQNGEGWMSGKSKQVKYLSEAERAKLKLDVKEGKIYDAEGNLYDTGDAGTFFSGKGKSIFVMDESGNIYASKYQKVGEFHHSSILGGEPVAGAGEIAVRNGEITEISNSSGHYRPTQETNAQVVQELRSRGVDTSNINITGP